MHPYRLFADHSFNGVREDEFTFPAPTVDVAAQFLSSRFSVHKNHVEEDSALSQ